MLALVDHYPILEAETDAIVRVDAVTPGDDAIGTVEAVGLGVKTIDVGDRVLVASPAIERLRVPLADTAVCKVPEGATDGELLMLAAFFRRARPSSAAARAR